MVSLDSLLDHSIQLLGGCHRNLVYRILTVCGKILLKIDEGRYRIVGILHWLRESYILVISLWLKVYGRP